MRSVARGSFARLSAFESLWRAWRVYSRGKRRRPAVAAFALEADRTLLAVHRALRDGTYFPGAYRVWTVRDPKPRLIGAPPIRDRVVHQSLIARIAPTYERGFIDQSFAGCTGRGVHRALWLHLRLMRRHRYRLHLDIRRYFPSIDRTLLLALIAHRLRDEDTLSLIDRLLARGAEIYRTAPARELLGQPDRASSPGRGLAIGSLLSQWCGNLYLDGLDHFVKRELRVPGYLRYMDDFVLFADDRDALRDARAAVIEWLSRERHLALNPKRWQVQPARQPVVFLGAHVAPQGIGPSRKQLRRARAKLARRRDTLTAAALARSVASYRSLVEFGS